VTKRRAYGDGGLYWNERRQRWIATVTVGYDGRGKRMVKTVQAGPRPRPSRSYVSSCGTMRTVWPLGGMTTRLVMRSRIGWPTVWAGRVQPQ
jgi:hypothetical protein